MLFCMTIALTISAISGCSPANSTQDNSNGAISIEQAEKTPGIYILSRDRKTATPVTFDFEREDEGYQTTVTSAKSEWMKPGFADSYILWSEDVTDADVAEYTVDYQNGESLIYIKGEDGRDPIYYDVAQCAYWQGGNGTTDIHEITSINGVPFTDYALFNEGKMKKISAAISPDAICYTFFSKDTPEDTLANSEGKFVLSCASPASVMMGISGQDEIEVPLTSRFAFASDKFGTYDTIDASENDGYYEIALDTIHKPFMLFTNGEDNTKACLISILK